MSGSFFDTNVVLYPLASHGPKSVVASSLIDDGGSTSVQVLNEITNVARRKMRLPWVHIREFLTLVRGVLDVHPLTLRVHELGLDVAERYGLSTYDSLIVAAALEADCGQLWSEDMQHGLLVDGRLRIANPFGGMSADAI